MNDEQRTELRKQLRGDAREPVIPFAQPSSLTRVYAVASGKGGVGKSTVTVNLAAAMAARGLSVGVLDADIHGHSIPRMMGTTDRPTQVESMILPPIAHEVKVISIAQFTEGNTPVVWRGPMLHRALQQFLADVYWGDLDVLLLDLPPGHRRHRHLGGSADPERGDPGGDHAAAGRGRGRRTGRQHRAADPPAHRRRGGEHVGTHAAGRLHAAGLRRGRWPAGRRAAVAGGRRRRAAAGPDPAGPRAGGRRRCGHADRAERARLRRSGKELRSVADSLSSRRRGLAGVSLGLDPTRR